jgi:penicillin amidase
MAAAFFATAFFLVRWELKKSLPEISGTITLKGLSESVDVYRDEFGIPHIYAENRDDLMFAVGYVSAQDRLWQMDLTRRAATGKLAEIFGEPVIAADLVARTIGFGHIAIRQFENLSPDSQAILEAFSGGVNAYIERAETLPPEFRLLKFEPEPWRPSDSLATLKLIGWQLSKNYKSELALMRVAARLDDRRAADLRPSYPATGPLIISLEFKYEPVLLPYFDKGTQLLDEIAGISGGSNSWVIGPSLTKSGAPLLANDPHLSGTRIPSIWYFVHMVGAGYDTMGAVAPGSPLPLIGHNRRIGWGITNMNADIQDLYIEKINPANGDQYEYDGKWVDMQSRTERIGFRTADGSLSFLEKQIRSTIHGPLINDIAPGAVKAVSLRWTGLEPTPDFEALTRLNLAGNWEDFLGAMEKFSVAPQNFIYADVDGNIGYCGAGKIPIRKRGDGSMPQEGWTSENGWEGFIPFEEMPRVLNPSAGYIVTANNKVVSDAYKHLLSAQWAPSYRAKRIVELIETRAPHDAAGTARMHLDSKSLLAEFIVPKLTPALEGLEDRTLRKAANYLKEWNYENTTDSVAATIYHELLLKLAENTFADDMGREAASNYLEDYYLWLERFVELLEEDSHWFDDDLTKEIEKRDELIARSFREAVASLKGRLGGNMSKWQWGRVHQIEFRHPLDKISLIKRIFNLGPFPFPGDGETVNRGTFSFNKPYGVTMAASIRHIMDFSDLSETLGIHTTGQSGNPASSHYDDFAQPWLRGEYVKMRMNREYYIGEIEAHMTLAPAAPARAALN